MIRQSVSRLPKGISVFAVDPGMTTGWAWACVGLSELRKAGVVGAVRAAQRHRSGLQLADTRFRSGQVRVGTDFDSEQAQVDALIIEMQVCAHMGDRCSSGSVPGISDVVVEDFILRQRTMDRSLLSPVRVTAGLMQDLYRSTWPYCVSLQSASDAKSTVTDARLKAWGLYVPGNEHARDATRHLILALRRICQKRGLSVDDS